jgi:hypothetical protein
MELDTITKELALAELDHFTALGDRAAGAMAVKSMQLALTQLGWQVVGWIDEELKKQDKSAS